MFSAGKPTRGSVARAILERDSSWSVPDEPIEVGDGVAWLPDLVRDGCLLHVQIPSRFPRFMEVRLKAAEASGHSVHIALGREKLWDEEVVQLLGDVDARVHLLTDNCVSAEERVLVALSVLKISLPSGVRRYLAIKGMERCESATDANDKGQRLEELLGFLLDQSDELRVVERNLRTETEEIDIVAQAAQFGLSRCWAILQKPFILVEAKNWSSSVGKPAVSDLLSKLRSYRNTAAVALLVGFNGFTNDAMNHELRFASEDGTVVFVGRQELNGWVKAENLGDYFEDLVRKAMLR